MDPTVDRSFPRAAAPAGRPAAAPPRLGPAPVGPRPRRVLRGYHARAAGGDGELLQLPGIARPPAVAEARGARDPRLVRVADAGAGHLLAGSPAAGARAPALAQPGAAPAAERRGGVRGHL